MSWMIFAAGIVAILYGVYEIYNSIKSPSEFWELPALQQRFGKRFGTLAYGIGHRMLYTGYGIMWIISGLVIMSGIN